ncbi:MAG TPA: hypothetical protein VGD31_06535 [Sphingobacteriaceae bacterium]
MKFLMPFCLVIAIAQSAVSQTAANKKSHYVFPEFINGTVKLKSGIKHEALLNYNTILESMVISPKGAPMVTLSDLENVEAVYINDRKFIPSGNIFYEVVANEKLPYFIHYTCKAVAPGEAIGYGATSQLTNTSASVVKELARFYYMKLPENYTITPISNIIVVKDDKYINLNNYKKVAAVFPGKEALIKSFVKENKTDFNNAEDVKKLLQVVQ